MLATAGATRILVDAGRGVVMRLAAAGLFPVMLDAVLLTHLHSDQISDLNDVITTHWVMTQSPTTLRIYGPPGTREVVDGIFAMLRPDMRYRVAHHDSLTWEPVVEVHELDGTEEMIIGETRIVVRSTDHRPVEPTVGFRIEHEGKVAVLAGDTVPCAGLDELCASADVYVQTVVRDDLVKLIPNARLQDILNYHSSLEQAAQTAQRNGVRTFVCTHYVPAPPPEQAEEWRTIAAHHFTGTIVLADDLTVITA
jgi:ribonuclease Z